MVKRRRSSINSARKRRRIQRNVQRGETIKQAVLSNGVRGRVSKNSAIHRRTYRGRYKRASKGLKRARRGNVGTKPSTITTSQMTHIKVLPNQKGIVGQIARKITMKDPYVLDASFPDLNVNGGGYQVPAIDNATGQYKICDKFNTYETMLGDTTTEEVLTSHRMDWTMFTNDSWKDNLCYLLGLFSNNNMLGEGSDKQPTLASPNTGVTIRPGLADPPIALTDWGTGANGTAMWGYAPPNSLVLKTTSGTTHSTPYGTPVPTIDNTNNVVNVHSNNINQPAWALQQHYVLSESLTWYIHNQGTTDMTVILNECTLKYDIPMINGFTPIKTEAGVVEERTIYGGMLDPIELWRNSRTKQAFADKNNIETAKFKSALDTIDYIQGYSSNKDRLNNDIYDYGSSTKYADRLNACYNVKKHFQTIRPGQTAHFKVKVNFNHKVSPHQITNMYALGGKSKTFFFEFLTKPVAAGNMERTGATTSIITGQGFGHPPADISIKWTKSKRFLLDQIMPTNRLNVRGPRPKFNYFGIIENDGDRKVIITNGNDEPIGAEDVIPDDVNEINQAMGGVFDINIGDVTIF